jgi:hypothetical protein
MPREQQSPTEAVIEFGAPAPAPTARRRWSVSGVVGGMGSDRRTVPLAAAVGAVALFASMISEWQVTRLDEETAQNFLGARRPMGAGLADLGALGAGYLVGLFLLAGATVLVLFGPASGRRYARLAGLTVAGVQAAMLAALAQSLGSTSRAIAVLFVVDLPADQVQLSYGRGIWCGAVGVAAVALALWLAGRHLSAAPAEPGSTDATEEDPWSWRRPRTAPDDEAPDAPMDLTVTSVTPFTSRSEDRDAPT